MTDEDVRGEPEPARPDDAQDGGSSLPAVRVWPPGGSADAAQTVAARCAACGLDWRVHRSMCGFRMRCTCGQWIDVPPDPEALAPRAPDAAPVALPATRVPAPDPDGLVRMQLEPGEVLDEDLPVDLPLGPGVLERANVATRARWTTRTLVEFVALVGAILGPQLVVWLMSAGNETILLLPVTSFVSAFLVAIVVLASGPYGRLGLRGAAPVHWLAAIALAGGWFVAAQGFLWLLTHSLGDAAEDQFMPRLLEELGRGWTLVVVAVMPALLEEAVFRGVLQGRLLALLGRRAGLSVTALAFALCHGMPAVLPLHFGLGLTLGVLRERAGSLLPGVLMHFCYNATIVLTS